MRRHEASDYMPNWAFDWKIGSGWGSERSLLMCSYKHYKNKFSDCVPEAETRQLNFVGNNR